MLPPKGKSGTLDLRLMRSLQTVRMSMNKNRRRNDAWYNGEKIMVCQRRDSV